MFFSVSTTFKNDCTVKQTRCQLFGIVFFETAWKIKDSYLYKRRKLFGITVAKKRKPTTAEVFVIGPTEGKIRRTLADKILSKFKAKNPKISVVVASYNYAQLIRQTLDSLVNQTYKNFEVIVVDDGSTDNSVEVIREYVKKYPNVFLYQHENNSNKGLQLTVKLGVEKAAGKYVAFCESDDFWTPNHLEEKVQVINSHFNPIIIVNNLTCFGDPERVKSIQPRVEERRHVLKKGVVKIPFCDFRDQNWIVTFSCCMVKRSALLACDFTSNNRPSAIDWWLWRQICFKAPIYYTDSKLTHWRLHKSYNTTTKNCCRENQLTFLVNMDKILLRRYPLTKLMLLLKIRKQKLWTSTDNPQNLTLGKTGRLAIFASYSEDGKVSDSVIYNLKELKKTVDGIILIADNSVVYCELEKIKNLVIHSQFAQHNEYDFGSYKRGLDYIYKNKLDNHCDTIIFCNDSCYGPIYPLKTLFDKMDKLNCDFWGLTENISVKKHIQSYFFVIKKSIIESKALSNYLNDIKAGQQYAFYQNLEINLTAYLVEKNYTYSTFIDRKMCEMWNGDWGISDIRYNPTRYPLTLIDLGFPFLKKRILKDVKFAFEDVNKCMKLIKNVNTELFEFISQENPECIKVSDSHSDDLEKVSKVAKSESKKRKGVIYTCITGGYDGLTQHSYIDNNWDYICFCDNPEMTDKKKIGHWQICALQYNELDQVRNARWHKTHPHLLLPEYEYSVWLDANINITSDLMFRQVQKCIDEKRLLSAPEHPIRSCVYEEALAVKLIRCDFQELIDKQISLIKQKGFPPQMGMNETGLLFRRHHEKLCREMMESWWELIQNYSRRDQLSFTYVAWKHNYKLINLLDKPGLRSNPENFLLEYKATHSGKLKGTKKELKTISIVIPIYNALHDVKQTLQSVERSGLSPAVDIILVNDASAPETTSYLRKYVKGKKAFKLLENEVNLGFVKSCNRGMRESSGDIVVLLNSDTMIPKRWEERVLKCFNFHEVIGIASPIASSSGLWNIPFLPGLTYDQMDAHVEKSSKRGYPSLLCPEGFCFCIRRAVINDIGYLDEIFGRGYCEETDYAMRALKLEWRLCLIDNLYVYHKRHASFGLAERNENMEKNAKVFWGKWKYLYNYYDKSVQTKSVIETIKKRIYGERYQEVLRELEKTGSSKD
jgi:O-antigen biosynthesis protein